MGQSVQQGCGHFFINKHRRPFDKAEIGGNDDAGPLIEFADQVEQQCTTSLAEGQVAQLIQYHQIGVDQPVGYPPLLPSLLLLFQGIDQFDSGEEPYPLPVVLAGLHRYRGRQMGFARTRATHKHHILGIFQELASVQ